MSKRKAAGSDLKRKQFKKKKTEVVVLKPELKAQDISIGVAEFILVGSVELLNPLSAGGFPWNRIGRKVTGKSVHIRGVIRPITGLATDIEPDILRLICVYDKQVNGAPFTINDILQDCNAGASTSVLSQINLGNRERFEILRDIHFPTPKVIAVNQELIQALDQVKPSYNLDWFIPLNKKTTTFNQLSNGNMGDITTGAISLFSICGDSANNYKWNLVYTSRYRFYDS